MSDLVEMSSDAIPDPDLRAVFEARGMRRFEHDGLHVILSVEDLSLEEAHERLLGIRRWRHISVSVIGQWQLAMEDIRTHGRRGPGERSPVPLPDWYDLTHLAYDHATEFGFSPLVAVWQYLPPPSDPYVNFAEALHLRQPA